jgi:hypothetical protein
MTIRARRAPSLLAGTIISPTSATTAGPLLQRAESSLFFQPEGRHLSCGMQRFQHFSASQSTSGDVIDQKNVLPRYVVDAVGTSFVCHR